MWKIDINHHVNTTFFFFFLFMMTGETVPHLPPPTARHCSCLIARSQKFNTCKATKGNVLLSSLWVAVNRKQMCRDARGTLILLGAEFTTYTEKHLSINFSPVK